mmetsp:Transcript_31518/g.62938  ORF Transcript_31518/g.62938 Transcript_31518/m.62938 type:complete len:863 (+) Transcript_31518:83-2671(+)
MFRFTFVAILATFVPSIHRTVLGEEDLVEGGGAPTSLLEPVLFRSTACPNTGDPPLVCSGNGICGSAYYSWSAEDIINCKCYDGFTGADCSLRVCPSGVAWADMPFGNDTAHQDFVECSNFGYCDRLSGECVCRDGYTGNACERLSCPLAPTNGRYAEKGYCSGHGSCLNLNEAGQGALQLGNRADAFDGTVRFEKPDDGRGYVRGPKDWDDGHRVQGCVCEPGWEGHDCSLRSCLVGDDPMTSNQTDDQQLLDCSCFSGVQCQGTFRLRFRGHSSRPLPFNATIEYLKYFLEQISTVSSGGVEVTNLGFPGSPLCSVDGEATRVTFKLEHGPLPALEVVQAHASLDVQVQAGGNKSYFYPWVSSVRGTKEELKCSGRGTCDRRNVLKHGAGSCNCFQAFKASDERGRTGLVPDCGFFDATATGSKVTDSFENNTQYGCPVAKPLHAHGAQAGVRMLCSGRGGNCSAASDFKCNCTLGYTGPGCEYRDCPASRSWFQQPHLSSGRAHLKGFKCSNGGSCDETVGQCQCDAKAFDGSACHTLACPYNKSLECGGAGKCWTLNKLARYALSPMGERLNISYSLAWDAFKIRICNCGRPFAVDSQVMTYRDLDRPALLPTVTEKTFRGPYAYQSTPGAGYDCSKVGCPTGDDVFTHGVNEVHEVRCNADGGAFKMFWRGDISPDILWDYRLEDIRAVFESMLSVGKVDIKFGLKNNNTFACGKANHSFFVEYQTEYGDLPLLKPIVKNRDNTYRLFKHGSGAGAQDSTTGAAVGVVQVTRYQKCTKENLECGRQGICNEDTGFCHCMAGLVSGGGTRHEGHDSYGSNAYGHRGDCGYRHADTRSFNHETRYRGTDTGGRFGDALP